MSDEIETPTLETPTEIVPDNTETVEAPNPETPAVEPQTESEAAFLDPGAQYRMSIDGQEQQLTGAQYDYLAQAGARALLEAQKKQEGGEASSEATPPAAENAPEPDSIEARLEALEKRNQSLEDQLRNTEVTAEGRRLMGIVDDKFQKSPVFELLKATDETQAVAKDLKEEVFAIAQRKQIPVEQAGEAYFTIGARFGFDWLRRAAGHLPTDTAWDKLAVTAIIDDLFGHQGELTSRVLSTSETGPSPEMIEDWSQARRPLIAVPVFMYVWAGS